LTDLEAIKGEIKKLSSQAVQAKLNLHDLAEDLPVNWELIPAAAENAFALYKELEAKRAILKTMEE
jgi:hypothetical protein